MNEDIHMLKVCRLWWVTSSEEKGLVRKEGATDEDQCIFRVEWVRCSHLVMVEGLSDRRELNLQWR